MALSFLVIIAALLAVIIIPLTIGFMSGGKGDDDGTTESTGSAALTAFFIILGVMGFLGAGLVVILFFVIETNQIQEAQVILPMDPVAVVEAEPLDRRHIVLNLKAGSAPGSFKLTIINPSRRSFSPSSLQDLAENMAWYVQVGNGPSYDSVDWKEEEFKKEIPIEGRAAFQISVPLEEIEAKTGDTLFIYYQYDPNDGQKIVKSNVVHIQ